MQRPILIFLILVYTVSTSQFSFAQTDFEDAQRKAEEIYKEADSDVIYLDNVMKSLYYQNIQIIELLKEIQGLMKQFLEKAEQASAQEE
ncbi:MAG: hypothetical protein JXD21_00930 [Candidatus Omnitrophica bacterium]|nr:hypothetical protein [Candidatus Omnitrophota bacterium]